jgi:hypothetical protein
VTPASPPREAKAKGGARYTPPPADHGEATGGVHDSVSLPAPCMALVPLGEAPCMALVALGEAPCMALVPLGEAPWAAKGTSTR